ncbi:MAG: Crp/Fnr family transcriptional regulator [Deltaproteobacteria bacterium]|nr:Crp/Fnr family transcriptional regulator [Deltaproteobacteria bacterium]
MQLNSPHYARCLKILSQSPLFSSLDEALLKDMLKMLQYETRVKDETAISPKQASDRLYIITSGRAKVSVYNPENGREHILFLLEPGDGFDLISLLDSGWHDAVATALDDMEVLSTTLQQAREWLNQHPDFNRAFLPYLGKQMHGLADQVVDLSLYDTEVRLARLILRHLVPDKLTQEIPLINNLSQETMASMIGSVRVVITRHLSHWKQKKIISGRRGHCAVEDLQALLEKADQ